MRAGAGILHASTAPQPQQCGRYGALLAWLPPLMLVCANTHGSFIAGFTILGAFTSSKRFYAGGIDPTAPPIIISVACAFCAALINPYRARRYQRRACERSPATPKQYTIEWLPFAFSASTGVSAWLIVFIFASNLRGSRAPIADKLLAIGWLVATLFIMRNGPIFILLSAPYLATCLDEATQGLREVRKPSPAPRFLQRQPVQRVWTVLRSPHLSLFLLLPFQR